MRREAKVGIYVPKEWQDRFNVLNTIAYGWLQNRNPTSDQPKYSTRIKWGHSDLILYRIAKYWTALTITTPLPAIDLAAVAQPRMSPAPGRNGR